MLCCIFNVVTSLEQILFKLIHLCIVALTSCLTVFPTQQLKCLPPTDAVDTVLVGESGSVK